ncbi:terminase small subunit [Aquimarina macrocephali]|uniref:terminase small subunit n=1 Tax=Aquimarina macrocephali TaxID=666563 RepID=UPI003F668C78
MGAPKGNQFWKLRSKHGRDKLFATPELLWEAACEYFQWCDDNPLIENKVINSAKEGVVDHPVSKVRVYTLNGLCLYLDCNDAYLRQFKVLLRGKEDKLSKDFSTVITHIEKTIYEQQFTNAAADLLNANIISRSLGLTDKKDLTSGGEKIPSSQPQQVEVIFKDFSKDEEE